MIKKNQNNFNLVYGLCLLMSVMLSACQRTDESKNSPLYESTYKRLWLVHSTLDYPGTKSVLDACRTKQLEKCMQLVTRVSHARDQLLQIPHDEALNNVLDTIAQRCRGRLI